MKWLRLYHALAHSIRVGSLSDKAFRTYILCQCAASEQRKDGCTKLKIEHASWQFRFDCRAAVEECCATDPPLLEVRDGVIWVPDWNERQSDSDSSYDRVKRYRERVKNGGATVAPAIATKVMERDGHACVYCGGDERLTIDHLIPVIQGGDNGPDNLATACRPCNGSKKGRRPDEAGMGFFNPDAMIRYEAATKRVAEKAKRTANATRNVTGNVTDNAGEERRGDKTSVPNGTAPAAPARADMTDVDEVWKLGLELLLEQGNREVTARSFLGQLRKKGGDEQVLDALRRALVERPTNVRSWLAGLIQARANGKMGPPRHEVRRGAAKLLDYGDRDHGDAPDPNERDITSESTRLA